MDEFIKKLVGFSLKNKWYVFITIVVLVAGGVYSAFNTAIEAYPEVLNTRVIIITQWPGRSTSEVEKFITVPIETAMNSVPGKTSLRSVNLYGLSVVTIMFDDDIKDFEARQNVSLLLQNVNLPDGVMAGIEPPYGPTGEIYRYTLKSDIRSPMELRTLQDWVIERQLRTIPGIADVNNFGGDIKTFEVTLDPNLLVKYGFTANSIFTAIQNSNVNVGGDVLVQGPECFVVRGIGLLKNIKDIENIIVSNVNGTPILVKNIATVTISKQPNLGYVARDSVTNLIECIVVMRNNEVASKVLQDIHKKVDELNHYILPSDVKIVPFYDRTTLIKYTVGTVTHNLMEGILLVIFVVSIFMANWRTTLIVALIIPLSLLFALICLKLKGMSANLLSIGAIDFGIIIDGAVVMVEGTFVILDHKAHEIGMKRFNLMSKLGIIKRSGGELAKPIFFSKLIIITAMIPIFTFQKVEGKLFSPLAWTIGFALIGSLIFSLTLVPVLMSLLLKKDVKEKENFFLRFVTKNVNRLFTFTYTRGKASLIVATTFMIISVGSFHFLGSEFLPQLNEGAVYIRASMPYGASLPNSIEWTERIRKKLLEFDEVARVLSQTGRPDNGTDATGFFNIEMHTELKPHEEWKRNITKDELIKEMQDSMDVFPGINFNFSQPIMDNIEEAVSGVKGSMACKIYGYDIEHMENLADSAYNIMKNIQGVEDLGIIRLSGQPELRITLDQQKMAFYGVNMAAAADAIEMAIGGKAVSSLYEEEKKFDVRVRLGREYRDNEGKIGEVQVSTVNGSMIPLKEIADIRKVSGPAFIYRESNQRYIAVKFSVRDRDLSGTIAECEKKVGVKVNKLLTKGMKIQWQGEFENLQRAQARLAYAVPLSILIIFLILFIAFRNFLDCSLVMLNVPYAIAGGIWALFLTHTNFSISAGVGMVALFGICIQDGVIVYSIFDKNIKSGMQLDEAIIGGIRTRIRPVLMTALIASMGLLPAALSTGIGSESQKPLAIVVIGGLITSTFNTLFILPIMFKRVYAKAHEKRTKPSGVESKA